MNETNMSIALLISAAEITNKGFAISSTSPIARRCDKESEHCRDRQPGEIFLFVMFRLNEREVTFGKVDKLPGAGDFKRQMAKLSVRLVA